MPDVPRPPDAPSIIPRWFDLALYPVAIVLLFPLAWHLARIIWAVAADMPMEQQPWPSPHGW